MGPIEHPDSWQPFTYSVQEPGQPLLAIVEAVAWVLGSDPTELEPLQQVVDIEALVALFRTDDGTLYRGVAQTRAVNGLQVSFEYEGCQVSVDRERILVRPA